MDVQTRARAEIEAFQLNEFAGYCEGDPLDPMGPSSFLDGGYLSSLYACYLVCIRPYVGRETRVLEIGPGRGAWTRCFVAQQAKEITCVDVVSAERNRFWQHVGEQDTVRYVEVGDISLQELPEDAFDYWFSFGVFCHLSPAVFEAYLRSIYAKLRDGAHGFFLIADYEKYNRFVDNPRRYSVARAIEDWFPELRVEDRASHPKTHFRSSYRKRLDEDDAIDPRRWYHVGVDRAARMLRAIGFEVVDEDVGVLHRDPIMHVRKP